MQADRGDSERGIVGFAKQLGPLVAARIVANVVGSQLYLSDIGRVAVQVDIGVAPALEIVEGKARYSPAGFLPEVFD